MVSPFLVSMLAPMPPYSPVCESNVLHLGLGEVARVRVELSEHGLDAGFHQFARRQFIDVEQIQFTKRRLRSRAASTFRSSRL